LILTVATNVKIKINTRFVSVMMTNHLKIKIQPTPKVLYFMLRFWFSLDYVFGVCVCV